MSQIFYAVPDTSIKYDLFSSYFFRVSTSTDLGLGLESDLGLSPSVRIAGTRMQFVPC